MYAIENINRIIVKHLTISFYTAK